MSDNIPRLPSFHETEKRHQQLAGLDLKQLEQLLGSLPPYLKTGPTHLISASGAIQRVQVSAKSPHLVKLRYYKKRDCRIGRADRLAVIVRRMIANMVAPTAPSKPPSAARESRIKSTEACTQGNGGENGIAFHCRRRAMRILQLWGNARAHISPGALSSMERHLSDHDKVLQGSEQGGLFGTDHGHYKKDNSPVRTLVSAGAIGRAQEILHLLSPGWVYPEHRVHALAEILEKDDCARRSSLQRRQAS